MAQGVKNRSTTRVSSKHQVTITGDAFVGAGLRAGDSLKVEALGPGQVLLTRVDDLLDRHSGRLAPGAFPPGWLEELRGEWD